jgi:hypothetical protein
MLKTKIFDAIDVKTREVKVPEWNVTLFVRSMSGTDRARFKAIADRLQKEGKEADADSWLLILTAVDEQGNRIFSDEDFEKLNSKSATVLTHVAKEALIVNGLLPESIDEAKKN